MAEPWSKFGPLKASPIKAFWRCLCLGSATALTAQPKLPLASALENVWSTCTSGSTNAPPAANTDVVVPSSAITPSAMLTPVRLRLIELPSSVGIETRPS